MMPRMRVVGIDPSLTRTGIAIVEDGVLGEVASFGPRKGTLAARLTALSDFMDRFLTRYMVPTVSTVAIEDQIHVQVGKRGAGEMTHQNSKTLMVAGIAIGVAQEFGAKILFIRPQDAKIAALGKGFGNATKAEVRAALTKLRGIHFQNDDESDAAAIAIAAHRISQLPEKMRQKYEGR